MELNDYSVTARSKYSDGMRAFRQAERSGLTTLPAAPHKQSWFARMATGDGRRTTTPMPKAKA